MVHPGGDRPSEGDHNGDHYPAGQGHIIPCPDCNGVPRRDCLECDGEGRYIRPACPLCGDPGWDYVNGTDDRDGMACRISCGYHWTADDHARFVRSLVVSCPNPS